MRIAVSGAHRTGKSTLIESLEPALAGYAVVDEPYHQLEEEGHEFAEMPALEDFERQLERSIECVIEAGENVLLDRCPADLVAYLVTHRDSDGFELDLWLPRVRRAMKRLDLVVYVPVEEPDRVPVPDAEEGELRRRVDEELRDILLDDRWAFGVETLEVSGSIGERARQVLARVGRAR
jgi:predicted ATPase